MTEMESPVLCMWDIYTFKKTHSNLAMRQGWESEVWIVNWEHQGRSPALAVLR